MGSNWVLTAYEEGLLNLPWTLNARILSGDWEGWILTNRLDIQGNALVVKFLGTGTFETEFPIKPSVIPGFPYGFDVEPDN